MNDRVFTAFVSSTYHDLRNERQRVAKVLLNNSCLPLGMEFFPSDGREVWSLIESSMGRADFFVLVVGARYGSLDTETGQSWTQREWAEMLRLGKPVIPLLRIDDGSLETDTRLAAFRGAIGEKVAPQYWADETDLVEKLALSVGAVTGRAEVAGWTRVPPTIHRPRPYRWENILYRTTWRFVPSERHGLLDAEVYHRRELRALDPDGIESVSLITSRPDTGDSLPLTAGGGPSRKLVYSSRSGGIGRVRLGDPLECGPKKHRQNLVVEPPLLPSDTMEFEVTTTFREARFARRSDLVAALTGSSRDWDWVAVNVTVPTEMLEMEVALDSVSGAAMRGVEAIGSGGRPDFRETRRAKECLTSPLDLVGHDAARLELPEPRLGTRYRLSWFLSDE